MLLTLRLRITAAPCSVGSPGREALAMALYQASCRCSVGHRSGRTRLGPATLRSPVTGRFPYTGMTSRCRIITIRRHRPARPLDNLCFRWKLWQSLSPATALVVANLVKKMGYDVVKPIQKSVC